MPTIAEGLGGATAGFLAFGASPTQTASHPPDAYEAVGTAQVLPRHRSGSAVVAEGFRAAVRSHPRSATLKRLRSNPELWKSFVTTFGEPNGFDGVQISELINRGVDVLLSADDEQWAEQAMPDAGQCMKNLQSVLWALHAASTLKINSLRETADVPRAGTYRFSNADPVRRILKTCSTYQRPSSHYAGYVRTQYGVDLRKYLGPCGKGEGEALLAFELELPGRADDTWGYKVERKGLTVKNPTAAAIHVKNYFRVDQGSATEADGTRNVREKLPDSSLARLTELSKLAAAISDDGPAAESVRPYRTVNARAGFLAAHLQYAARSQSIHRSKHFLDQTADTNPKERKAFQTFVTALEAFHQETIALARSIGLDESGGDRLGKGSDPEVDLRQLLDVEREERGLQPKGRRHRWRSRSELIHVTPNPDTPPTPDLGSATASPQPTVPAPTTRPQRRSESYLPDTPPYPDSGAVNPILSAPPSAASNGREFARAVRPTALRGRRRPSNSIEPRLLRPDDRPRTAWMESPPMADHSKTGDRHKRKPRTEESANTLDELGIPNTAGSPPKSAKSSRDASPRTKLAAQVSSLNVQRSWSRLDFTEPAAARPSWTAIHEHLDFGPPNVVFEATAPPTCAEFGDEPADEGPPRPLPRQPA